MTKTITEKDLAQILIEGTKVRYGPEKGEQVKVEFERLEGQPIYRRSAEELTAVVEKICGQEVEEVYSPKADGLDHVVTQNYEPSTLKVALKGTANLINKTRWYYPLVGMLPGKYQEKIAEKLGDNPIHYTGANIVAEMIGVSAATSLYSGSILLGVACSFGCFFYRQLLEEDLVVGSVIITIPYYLAKLVKTAGKGVVGAVKDSYSSASQQLKELEENSQQRLEQLSRIEEVQDPEIEFALEERELELLAENIQKMNRL
ncbi:MAG: hypothetical protein KKA62_00735 [Nanoarchaeota archaeon]|nr:hypothetical protein [Nanoarchaeota archaeon]MBU1644124.1 hypothetical protein [Nanoarchaeota archaeon]MBU1976460.1 hypothetical protein [Nanoarchaeota archaeon]